MTSPRKPVDVCDWLLGIIRDKPDSFDMGEWMVDLPPIEGEECRSVGCIGGWTGYLFGDHYTHEFCPNDDEENAILEAKWKRRQAARLGMSYSAADTLFMVDNDRVAELMLQDCRDHLAAGNKTITEADMIEFRRDARATMADEEELVASL